MGEPTTGAQKSGLDALLPAEIADKAEKIGEQKVRVDAATLLMLGVLAGAFIAFGALFSTTVLAGAAGAMPYGVSRLLAGLVFSLGLILVIDGGAELFTGNTLMIMALAARRVSLSEMLRAWAIVLVGNFVGAAGTAALVYLSGQSMNGGGAVAAVALKIAADKTALDFSPAFFLGVLCNVLVCLAVWMAIGARSTTDKILSVVFPISAFVAAGFEHSVANMYFIPLGLMLKAGGLQSLSTIALPDMTHLTWTAFFISLVPVTLGNIVGGSVLVGGVYWFIYLRPRPKS
jgi:formate/nitrite transporter